MVPGLTVGGGSGVVRGRAPAVPSAVAGSRVAPDGDARPGDGWRQRLDRSLSRYLRQRPGRAAVAVYDRTNGARYDYGEDEHFLLASVAKVDILLALLLKAQREHRQVASWERSLATSMIRRSDNSSAHRLYDRIGGQGGLKRTLRGLGIRDTWPGSGYYWGSTRSFPSEQVEVLDRLTDPGGPLTAGNRKLAMRLMSTVVREQRWGVGSLDRHAQVKNGWLPARVHGGLWTVNSVGRLTVGGHELLVAVLSDHSPSMGAGISTVEQVARMVVREARAATR
ncbi:hypothetical protein GCM10022248_91890 [Nonomuraea soli]